MKQNKNFNKNFFKTIDWSEPIGNYNWLNEHVCNEARSIANVGEACRYLIRYAFVKGYNLPVEESFDIYDKYVAV